MKNLIKTASLFLLPAAVCLSLAHAASSYDGPSYWQMDSAINRLTQTFYTLDNFKNQNDLHLSRIKEDIRNIQNTLVTNLSPDTSSSFGDVRSLGQKDLLLLEAAYTFSKQNEAQAGLYENSIKTLAFEKCLDETDCTFEKLNRMIDEEALKLASQAKKQAAATQKDLVEKINSLNEFITESENSKSLSNGIKILTKVNVYQGQLLTRLSEQLAMLNSLQAHRLQLEHQASTNQTKAGEQFFNAADSISSQHLDITLNG